MANEKIVGKAKGQIDEKRFHIPGLELKSTCPKCGKTWTHDFADDYLEYPKIGTPFGLTLYHGKCGHEYDIKVQLDVTLKIMDTKPDEE